MRTSETLSHHTPALTRPLNSERPRRQRQNEARHPAPISNAAADHLFWPKMGALQQQGAGQGTGLRFPHKALLLTSGRFRHTVTGHGVSWGELHCEGRGRYFRSRPLFESSWCQPPPTCRQRRGVALPYRALCLTIRRAVSGLGSLHGHSAIRA